MLILVINDNTVAFIKRLREMPTNGAYLNEALIHNKVIIL